MEKHTIPRWVISAYFREHPEQPVDEHILERLPKDAEPLGTEHQEWARARGPIMGSGVFLLLPGCFVYLLCFAGVLRARDTHSMSFTIFWLMVIATLFALHFAAVVVGDMIYHIIARRRADRWLKAQWHKQTERDFDDDEVRPTLMLAASRVNYEPGKHDEFYFLRDIAVLLGSKLEKRYWAIKTIIS